MKLLSVAVPCYNSQEYMKNCIDSLLEGQDLVEIIIVDDGICYKISGYCKGSPPGERRSWRSGKYRASQCYGAVL